MCYRLQPLILDMTVVYFFQGQMGENRKPVQNNMQKLDNITIKRMTAAAQTPFTTEDGYKTYFLYKQRVFKEKEEKIEMN